MILSKQELIRYSKQIKLDQIGLEGQKKLKKAKVLIIGAGGLGCPVMTYLAISGIGKIGIVDWDVIENSNLNRQVLYNTTDIKKKKVLSAKQKLNKINEYSQIITHEFKINEHNANEIICYYDIVIDTTDNFKTRYLINRICYSLHKTYIYGAVDEFEGQVATFHYKNGISYNNLYENEIKITENTCNIKGTMGITTGYIGNLQAIETIKLILGLDKKCKNYISIYNIINIRKIRKYIVLKRKSKKELDDKIKYAVNKKENSSLRNDIKIQRVIIDLRNKSEFTKQHMNKSINIPLNKLKESKGIYLIKKYTQFNKVSIKCDNNSKSIIASKLLEKHKIKHLNT
uniref:Molybdopterin biosynthesis protein n=1 Tax=Tolypiocladia glomerulata TaxID=860646 RepID=A0A1Z1MUR6_9FLOR|nr:Molybdopterin biosynthesis protein [Tolypiocladia glomerulata]ARW69823.1 Molybdopterin biosynthesis protein [Tolypiocladia glomerulata]